MSTVDPPDETAEDRSSFAPSDLTDGREPLDSDRSVREWKSRYEEEAKSQIRKEGAYLVVLFTGGLLATSLLHLRVGQDLLALSDAEFAPFRDYCYLFLGGVVGGVMFGMKWLYHAVAKGLWNQDRVWWRIFVPLLSGGLALAFGLLARSGLLTVLNEGVLVSEAAWGFAFLVGYFSDTASGKLYEIATTLFGSAEHHSPQRGPRRSEGTHISSEG